MELTQKLECTQDLSANNSEKEFPEQIGFLGICGVKYPLKKGPNKIGRDPDTCNIVLNLNSISRQHAVINILNSFDFMLMDLDSANKTKLADKTLQAYIPHPIKNGDMVQFGQVFGVFRLFEEDNDLPMTQALDIPETPVRSHPVSKVNNLITTIPESPDVSDRDDSFIVASQAKPKIVFKSPNTHFIKSSGKSVSIKPVGINKIDNVFWSSSKKSDSFSLESDSSRNDSDLCLKSSEAVQNIHEQDTQCNIYNKSEKSIYVAETQVPENIQTSIHSMETQLPEYNNLPEVMKIQSQVNVNLDLFTENKQNENKDVSETQNILLQKEIGNTSARDNIDDSSSNKDVSDDIILFDDIDSPLAEDNFESQQLLVSDLEAAQLPVIEENEKYSKKGEQSSNRRNSGSSTDSEEVYFALTQKIQEKRFDDDETDCEDEPDITNKVNKEHKTVEKSNIDDDLTDCEDNFESKGQTEPLGLEEQATQTIEVNPSHYKINSPTTNQIIDLEDLPTQIIEYQENYQENISNDAVDLEDLPTQIINQDRDNIFSEEVVTPFKVPATSPLKRRRRDPEGKPTKFISCEIALSIDNDDEEKYYGATQEILNDLCTQENISLAPICCNASDKDVMKIHTRKNINEELVTAPSDTDDIDKKIDRFVMNLTSTEVVPTLNKEQEIVSKNLSSDNSDVESTPRKLKPLSFFNIALPNTQEIKKYVQATGDTSPESLEMDTDSSDSEKKIKKMNKKGKIVKRTSLLAKLESEELPERVITRVRKPTNKLQQSSNVALNTSKPDISTRLSKKESKTSSEAEAVLANTSNHKAKPKKSTRKSDNNNKKKVKELNKSKENIKKDSIDKNDEQSKSKETVKSGRKNKTIKENRRGIDKNSAANCGKTKATEDNIETTKINQSTKISVQNEVQGKKGEEQEKRKTNRTRGKQNEAKSDDKQMVQQIKNKNSNSSSRNKNNRKEINTIDKFIYVTTVNEQTKEMGSRTTETENRNAKKGRTGSENGGRDSEKRSRSSEKKSRSSEKEIRNTEKGNRNTDKERETSEKRNKSIGKRSKNTDKENEVTESKFSSTETRSKTKSKEIEKIETSSDLEVRRSKRQRTAKRSFEIESKQSKTAHEQSTVYNISSESALDSPNVLKRQASDFSLPSAKKTRICSSSKVALRATPARKIRTHYVLFTAFPCEEVKDKLQKLGAVVVTDIMQCTVVLTLQIKRTFKLLCAVGLGRPIVGPNWVQACVDTNMIVDPWLYLIKDEQSEKRFQFNLERILTGSRQFLKGYNVSSTPNVMPSPPEMKLIVECSGGTWAAGGRNWICVSSITDKFLWPAIKRRGATIVTTEFILAGVLRQKVDIDRNVLL